MKKYVFVFVILLSYEFAISQSVFQKKINSVFGFSCEQTNDGGFVMCGMTLDSTFTDVYLMKTNYYGDTMWTKRYGGVKNDWGTIVRQTTDNGFIIAGGSESFGSGFEHDLYLLKTDSLGNLIWSTAYGDSHYESVFSVQETTDGGYILAGNISIGWTGQRDINVVKFDAIGNVIWTQIVGGANDEYLNEIQQTLDGGFVLIANTNSFGAGNKDALLVKMDSVGAIQWSKTYGTPNLEEGNSVQQTSDGGYVLTGVAFNKIYMLKIDTVGNFLWAKKIGNAANFTANSIKQTADNGYIISGSTFVSASNSVDMCLVKTDSIGGFGWSKSYGDNSL